MYTCIICIIIHENQKERNVVNEISCACKISPHQQAVGPGKNGWVTEGAGLPRFNNNIHLIREFYKFF